MRAAYVSRPAYLSGWNRAKHEPRPVRRLVPPGSVYFFHKADGARFSAKEMRDLWLCLLQAHGDDGLGRFVPGLWLRENPMRTPVGCS